jgi:hypothetical protein
MGDERCPSACLWGTATSADSRRRHFKRSSGPPRTSSEVARLSRCDLRAEGRHDLRAIRSCSRSWRSTTSPVGAHAALRHGGAAPGVGPGLHAGGRTLEGVAAHRSRARRPDEAPPHASSRGRDARARGACRFRSWHRGPPRRSASARTTRASRRRLRRPSSCAGASTTSDKPEGLTDRS